MVVDIFPSNCSKKVSVFKYPETKLGFKKIRTRNNVKAVWAYLENGKLYYHQIKKWNKRMVHNFYYVFREALFMNTFTPDCISWDEVQSKLQRRPLRTSSRNTDSRISFCWKNNVFLVKGEFTFGQRTVADGTCHIYQTTAAPLLFYYLPAPPQPSVASSSSSRQAASPAAIRMSRVFRDIDQFAYKRYILEPNSKYLVPPNTTYVLMTVQKTLFTVNLVERNVAAVLPFECKSPYETTKMPSPFEKIYKFAPMTPALDTLEKPQEEEEEEEEEEECLSNNEDEHVFATPLPPPPLRIITPPPPQPDEIVQEENYYSPVTDEQQPVMDSSTHEPPPENNNGSSNNQQLFPPPPPPPPPTTTIFERQINIVTPEFVKYYQKINKQEYGQPLQLSDTSTTTTTTTTTTAATTTAAATTHEEEPMDLTFNPNFNVDFISLSMEEQQNLVQNVLSMEEQQNLVQNVLSMEEQQNLIQNVLLMEEEQRNLNQNALLMEEEQQNLIQNALDESGTC